MRIYSRIRDIFGCAFARPYSHTVGDGPRAVPALYQRTGKIPSLLCVRPRLKIMGYRVPTH